MSRRGVPPPEFIETNPFDTPITYRIPPFSVRVYGPAAMAGGKVNALLSENRSVPRDVYDLSELIRHGADPTELWIRRIPRQGLERKRPLIMAKVELIDFAMAAAELLPYIAPEIRQSMDEARWDEIRLDVAHHVEGWMDSAIARADDSGEDVMSRQPTSILLGAEAPRVLTIPMLGAVLSDRRKQPARNTLFRWVREQVASGALRPMTRGLYVNQLATPRPAAAEAAGFIRTGAIVSLQTVLGEAGITNNFPDVVTSVVPHERSHVPSVRPVKAADIEFRFHSMPARLLDDRAGELEDRMDLEAKYSRATLEKALLDWLYLGESRYSKIAGPPMDIEIEQLNGPRLRRLARSMELVEQLKVWHARKKQYDLDPDVRENASDDE